VSRGRGAWSQMRRDDRLGPTAGHWRQC
jgi:hypothetical protein